MSHPSASTELLPAADTRERLLDSAEMLFAEHGFGGASLRQITERAGANIAAVNYHFRSKEGLYEEVFVRRVRPMNEVRLRRLLVAEAEAQDGPPPLRQILDILLRPIVELATSRSPDPHPFPRVMSRNLIEPQPFMREVIIRELGPVLLRAIPLCRAALPHLEAPLLGFRLCFLLGATNMTFAAVPFMPELHHQLGLDLRPEQALEHLLTLAEAVLHAPVPPTATSPS